MSSVKEAKLDDLYLYCTSDTGTGQIPKVWLAAGGFEVLEVSELQNNSPISLYGHIEWSDIKSAFVQGIALSCDIYIKALPEAKSERTLQKLKKCVFVLADGSLHWYNRVKEIVLTAGGKMSQLDPAVFYWPDQDYAVTGAFASYVNDFILRGTQSFSTTVILQHNSLLGMRNMESFVMLK